MAAEHDLLGMLSGGAMGLGIGGLLLILSWELLRTLLFLGFVLVMCRTQGRRTGRYPTLAQAAAALRMLLGRPRLLSRLTGRKPKG
jgi:hypothetical protein